MATMQRWHGLSDVPKEWGRSVVTVGVFDGVHRGHQHILHRVVQRARQLDVPAVVVTFDPHPSHVLRLHSHLALLSSLSYRVELFERCQIDAVCVLPFTAEFSRISPEDFVNQVLVDTVHAAVVIVGENFRFGHRAAGDVALLATLEKRHGFTVEGVPLVGEEPEQFSSTSVRTSLAAGDVATATRILGRPHRVEGLVVHGDARGRTLGYPTANVAYSPHVALPADGVYAGWLIVDSNRLPAAISVGTNPTFGGTERRVEAYILDRNDLDLYGAQVAVEFAAWLRDQERFDSVDQLITRITDNVARARHVLRELSR